MYVIYGNTHMNVCMYVRMYVCMYVCIYGNTRDSMWQEPEAFTWDVRLALQLLAATGVQQARSC
jgi:hypothetical protein